MQTGTIVTVTQFFVALRTKPFNARSPRGHDQNRSKKDHRKAANKRLQMLDPKIRGANG